MFHDVHRSHKHVSADSLHTPSGQHDHVLTVLLALQENLLTSIFPDPKWVINGVLFYFTNSEQSQDFSDVSN